MSVEDLFSCKGKAALVTGASSGLGFAMAEAMADVGANVACGGRDPDRLQEIVEAVTARGVKAIAVRYDVSKEVEVERMVAETVQAFGGLDILFNNAGIGQQPKPLHELSAAEWKEVIDVDLHGAYFCAREALKIMVPRRAGKIINTASMFGLVGSSSMLSMPAYNAAKGALVNLTRELGLCYAPFGINVNGICPGFFKTRIGNNSYDNPDWLERIEQSVPLGRIGLPDEIKGAAIFLASNASSYVCGEVITIDGGVVAR